ncbi:DUF4214 domain-containing protein [Vreelandella gomseomensis]|uniref:DUF4214 domain-containing protein n=1 Tax=Vreelandella gomseomensis TaxID=370766 RepID=A0ABU1GEU9_9GAMM|nr:DUF4214 domain-containing protein [Halomonas gomseomensis]MDR5876011.1 DUF4214 domain-containing protein [Halomonas gomseomensis]
METTNAIQQIYIGLLGRAADQEGLQYWTDEIEAGTLTLEQLRANIVEEQPEYEATFGGQTRAQVVSQLYANLFNRAPDDEGLQYWVNGEGAGVNIDQLVLALVNGASAADTLVLDNRTEVANYYTTELGAEGSFDAELAAAVIADVDGTRASVTQAKTSVDNGDIEAPTANEGQTFTLTDSVGENIVGTANNDTFRALVDNDTDTGGTSTLNVSDTINGMGGTDTVNLTFVDSDGTSADAASLPTGVAFDNVEIANLNLTNAGAAFAAAINTSAFADAEQIWQIDNTSGNAAGNFAGVTGLTADVTAGFRSDGSATADLATGVVLTSGATVQEANLAVDGIGSTSDFTFAGAGLETLNISGSMRDGTILEINDAGQEETINIGLAGNVEVNSTGVAGGVSGLTTATTIDLSDSTGNITMNVTDAGALETLTGGAGNDSLTVDLEDGNDVTVNSGAGNDTVVLAGSGAGANNASTITFGAGKDTLDINTISNIFDADEADFEAGIITVADFNVSEDVLDLGGASTTLTNTQLDNIAGQDNLFDAAGQAITEAGANGLAVFNYGDNAYVIQDEGTGSFDSGDGLVELTGVQVEDFNAQNFVA